MGCGLSHRRASPAFASVSGRFETCPYAFVYAARRGRATHRPTAMDSRLRGNDELTRVSRRLNGRPEVLLHGH